jgi:N-dimethylarginine dimethylaminohydrolase
LANGYVIAYEKAFSSQSVNKIKNEFSDRIIWVSDQDANNFACNAVNIDNDVILKEASDDLKAALSKNNFSVIEVDVSEFIKAGGACKCLTLEL